MTQKLFTKNFVLLILGQLTSLFGNFILKLALSMYVLEVTGSAAIFAGILSIATIPTIVLSPLGGILADRADRRNIMVTLDGLTGVSVLCATLLLYESNALTVITVLLVILSVLGAFETPTVQACIPTMLQGDNIMKGNAVVNQVASLSYLVAPMLGGVLYAVFGLKPVMYASVVCFFITALFECFIKIKLSTFAERRRYTVSCQTRLPIKYAIYFKRTDEYCKNAAFDRIFKIFCDGYYHSWTSLYFAYRSWIKCTVLWSSGKCVSDCHNIGKCCCRTSCRENENT